MSANGASPHRPTGWIGRDPPGSDAAGPVTRGPVAGRADAAADVAALLRAALRPGATHEQRRRLHVAGALAAADELAATGMSPAVLARVAEAVDVAGVAGIAALPRPVPHPDHARLLRRYLAAAADLPDHPTRDTAVVRWLGVVCVHLAIRSVR
jgi:hypothetical protein